MMKRKMILDVDTGVDDALAIAYAVASEEIDLLGITVSYGMAPVHYTYRNTTEILRLLRRPVPVLRGSSQPLERAKEYGGEFHGTDGLGETLGEAANDPGVPDRAVDFIIEQSRKHKRDLTIVTTGPLTNLARAIREDPSIVGTIGQVVAMGGALTCPGNATPFAEANVHIDPEAADAVFRSGLPITMVGLDVTRRTLLTEREVVEWERTGTEAGVLFARFARFYLYEYRKYYPYLEGCALHDPLAVGVAKNPAFVRSLPMFLRVDLEEPGLGRTTEDLHRRAPTGPNVQVCVQVEASLFRDDFIDRVGRILAERGD